MSARAIVGALCALAYLSVPARAATDPDRRWITLRTPHFAIHTYDGGTKLARRLAAYAEEAWELLNPVLGWEPAETVHIRLLDDVDGSNGLAAVMPYPVITIWAHPPSMDSDLADHTDWLRLLVFHEYTHIAHLDHATGVPRVLNTVFGKVLKPNTALPRWLTEGVATWVESNQNQGGRLESSRYRMVLRMAVLAGEQPSLAELTGKPLRPPRGNAWYLYGGYLVDHIARHAGEEALRAFIEAYGKKLVAYGMNIISRQTTGADLVQWYGRMLDEVRVRVEATRVAVMAEGLVEGRRLTRGGEGRRWPRFTPDGRHVVYVRSDAHSPSRLVRLELGGSSEEERIIECDGGCGRFVPGPEGRHLIATMGRYHRRVNHYRELVKVRLEAHLARGDVERLTRGLRAEAPAWSRADQRIWVVRNRWGKTWLEALDPSSWSSVDQWEPPPGARIDGPAPHPDGRIFASMHHQGNRDLVEIDPSTGTWRRLTSGSALEIDPVLSPDGRWLVYASDTTGIYNLYARDVSVDPLRAGHTYRLTNVLGGAFSPAISPDGEQLVYAGWTAYGDELFALPFDPEGGVSLTEPDSRAPRVAPEAIPVSTIEDGQYQILPTLLPRSWAPSLVAGPQGLSRIGLALTGRDASRRVAAGISAEWDPEREALSAAASLDLGTGWSDLRWVVGRYSGDQVLLAGDQLTRAPQEVMFTAVGTSMGFPAPVTSSRVGVTWTTALHRALGGPLRPLHAPDADEAVIPPEGVATSLRVGWSFNGVNRYPYSISAADGLAGGASFRLKLAQPIEAGLLHHQLRYHLRAYATLPWLEDHVLALILRGGWSGGAATSLEPFRLGGTPGQDLISALTQEVQTGSHWLRGYPVDRLTGTAFHLLTTEYRLPAGRIRRGLDTLPIFARDLSVAIFHDLGLAYSDPLGPSVANGALGAAGAEIRLTTDVLFFTPLRLRLGWAWGWGPGGGHQGYLVLASDP